MKRLVVCCDGTWQDLETDYPTNILKIAQSTEASSADGVAQIAFYDAGVGTGDVADRVGGGGFGHGIDENILSAYQFIILNWMPGDELYLFVYSRGAYTVRSLGGVNRANGILLRRNLRKMPAACAMYRDRQIGPDAPEAVQFREDFSHPDAAIGSFNNWQRSVGTALQKIGGGNWAGFAPGARDGSEYLFYVVGVGGEGFKRDPYARELTTDPPFPSCNCIIRDPGTFLWHDAQFRTPDFHNFVIYQLHVGTFSIPSRKINGGFLDVIDRLDHLEQLGVSAVQFLPVVELPTQFSLGYNGTDYFSPENDYEVTRLGGDEELNVYLDRINSRLTARGFAPYSIDDLDESSNQLRVLMGAIESVGERESNKAKEL